MQAVVQLFVHDEGLLAIILLVVVDEDQNTAMCNTNKIVLRKSKYEMELWYKYEMLTIKFNWRTTGPVVRKDRENISSIY